MTSDVVGGRFAYIDPESATMTAENAMHTARPRLLKALHTNGISQQLLYSARHREREKKKTSTKHSSEQCITTARNHLSPCKWAPQYHHGRPATFPTRSSLTKRMFRSLGSVTSPNKRTPRELDRLRYGPANQDMRNRATSLKDHLPGAVDRR